jgi:V/A-type H+-transporting ATPase subunit C
MNQEAYAYASAKVRALESYLLSDADIVRLVEAKDAEVAFKVLNDTDYGSEMLDLQVNEYKVAINRKLLRLQKVLLKTIPDYDLLKLLYLEYDYNNIKLLFKARYFSWPAEEWLIEFPGLEKVDQLRRYITEDLDAGLDAYIKHHINQGKSLAKELGTTLSPAVLENFFDRKYFKSALKIAERLNNDFVFETWRRLIDIANAKITVRALLNQQSMDWVNDRLHNGGLTDAFYWQQAYLNGLDAVVNRLSLLWPGKDGFWDGFKQNLDLSQLDRQFQNSFLDHLRKAKLIGYGPETVVAYFFAKMNAVRNINIAMALKINQVPSQNIKNYLSELY